MNDQDSPQAEEMELACVLTCQGIELAQVYKSKLEAAGIPVLLRYDVTGPIFGLTIDGFGEVKVMVSAELAAEAKDILGVDETEALDEEEEEWPGEFDESEEETILEE